MGKHGLVKPQVILLSDLCCAEDTIVRTHEYGHQLPRDQVFARQAAILSSRPSPRRYFAFEMFLLPK